MSTFKQFLLTEGRTEPIDQRQAIEWAHQNSFQYITNVRQTGAAIYRGLFEHENAKFLFGDPSKHSPRVSANTSNEYTLLMDNLSNWEQFPKRSQSFICTSSIQSAKSFGEPFFVCPINTANIGIASEGDLWSSFKHLQRQTKIAGLDEFNEVLGVILNELTETKEVTTYNQLFVALKKLKQMLQVNGADYYIDRVDTIEEKNLINTFKQYNNDPLKAITRLLDPQINNFDIQKATNYNLQGRHEVWFSSPALLVDLSYGVEQFIEQILD